MTAHQISLSLSQISRSTSDLSQHIFHLPSHTSGSLPLHPVFSTEHDFVWCLPPAPFWWEQAMRQVRWTLYHAATEAANQGGSLRLRPPPKTKPDPFLLRHAVVIANADPHGVQALRRIQRLFLGWSDYDDLSGYHEATRTLDGGTSRETPRTPIRRRQMRSTWTRIATRVTTSPSASAVTSDRRVQRALLVVLTCLL